MRLLFAILLLSPAPLIAQTYIDQYYVGEYRNDVVFVGEYQSPGTCTFNDGIDFYFDFSGMGFPTGIELVLVIDEPNPSSTVLMNGWYPVNVGDSTTFTPQTTNLALASSNGPATINFHVRAVGTPTVAGDFYPCWVDAASTDAVCGNSYSLFAGESFAPCSVAVATGFTENLELPFILMAHNGQVTFRSEVTGKLELIDITGRVLHSVNVVPGLAHAFPITTSGIIIARLTGVDRTFSQKILIN
jgi:hypothetical protein